MHAFPWVRFSEPWTLCGRGYACERLGSSRVMEGINEEEEGSRVSGSEPEQKPGVVDLGALAELHR